MAQAADPKPAGAFDDDRPVSSNFDDLPPEVRAPLALFNGAEPPSPQWFKDAVAQAPERGFVTSLGSRIEVLTWGQVGKPGLLLVHGNSAHADWWSFIAPFLANDFRVAAMSLAGMGASDWRETYAVEDFAADAEAVAQAAGLYEGGRAPTYIGHSFGGVQVFYAATRHAERMHAAIMVDTGFGGPPPEVRSQLEKRRAEVRNIPTGDRARKVYPDMTAALARFRLMPPQPAGNPFIADFIARRSLKPAPLEHGVGEGWAWRFDPEMWVKLDQAGLDALQRQGPPRDHAPMAHIYGDRSLIMSRRFASEIPSPFPKDMIKVVIPESQHHVMIDQPLALVAALRALLAAWPT